MAKAKKEKRGGADRGQGRKNKYGEETTTFSCRVPISKKTELSKIVAAQLKRWLIKQRTTFLLYAGGDFGERIFNIALKPNRRTELDYTTSAPLA